MVYPPEVGVVLEALMDEAEQVTVSAINRNFQGRSGPGKLYLASPLTVAASAFTGHISMWSPDLFA